MAPDFTLSGVTVKIVFYYNMASLNTTEVLVTSHMRKRHVGSLEVTRTTFSSFWRDFHSRILILLLRTCACMSSTQMNIAHMICIMYYGAARTLILVHFGRSSRQQPSCVVWVLCAEDSDSVHFWYSRHHAATPRYSGRITCGIGTELLSRCQPYAFNLGDAGDIDARTCPPSYKLYSLQ